MDLVLSLRTVSATLFETNGIAIITMALSRWWRCWLKAPFSAFQVDSQSTYICRTPDRAGTVPSCFIKGLDFWPLLTLFITSGRKKGNQV